MAVAEENDRDPLLLESVSVWAQTLRRARRVRNRRIRQAHEGGWSYRQIAQAAGLRSVSAVAEIVNTREDPDGP